MTVRDYLEFAARLHQVAKGDLKKPVDWALEKTNLGEAGKPKYGATRFRDMFYVQVDRA